MVSVDDEMIVEVIAAVAVETIDEVEDDEGAAAESDGACASRLRPKAIENMLPPIIGERETKPQFSEKWAIERRY